MHRRSPILEKIADLYAESALGRTGTAARPYSIRFEHLLQEAGCESGDAYSNALADLAAHDGMAVALLKHRRSGDIQRVQVSFTQEAKLFARIGRTSPVAERNAWSELFREAAGWSVPMEHRENWQSFCGARADRAACGEGWKPLRRERRHRAKHQPLTRRRRSERTRPRKLLHSRGQHRKKKKRPVSRPSPQFS
jgi:hypothetical protein